MIALAQLLTSPNGTGSKARKAAGLALVSASVLLAGIAGAAAGQGLLRVAAATGAVAASLAMLLQGLEALALRNRELMEEALTEQLVRHLPPTWYVLGGLRLPAPWGEVVEAWAVVVAPGGVAVIQPFAEAGELIPYGHVWLVRRGKYTRMLPSPAAQCCEVAEAMRDLLGDHVPVIKPLVVLTDLQSTYQPTVSAATVVGAPHLPAAVLMTLGPGSLAGGSGFDVAAYLCQYSGERS